VEAAAPISDNRATRFSRSAESKTKWRKKENTGRRAALSNGLTAKLTRLLSHRARSLDFALGLFCENSARLRGFKLADQLPQRPAWRFHGPPNLEAQYRQL